MIRSLRKKHVQIWALWAIVLPIGIGTAWLSVPAQVSQDLLQPPSQAVLPSNVYVDSANQLKIIDTIKH